MGTEAAISGVWSRLPLVAAAYHDYIGIDFDNLLIPKAPSAHSPSTEILGHYVCPLHQLPDQVFAPGMVEVEGQAVLIGAIKGEEPAAVQARFAILERGTRSKGIGPIG